MRIEKKFPIIRPHVAMATTSTPIRTNWFLHQARPRVLGIQCYDACQCRCRSAACLRHRIIHNFLSFFFIVLKNCYSHLLELSSKTSPWWQVSCWTQGLPISLACTRRTVLHLMRLSDTFRLFPLSIHASKIIITYKTLCHL